MAITINLDVAEPRIQLSQLRGLDYGPTWDFFQVYNPGVVMDMATRTVFLTPLPVSPTWQTTTTGVYQRLKRANFSYAGATLGTAYWADEEKGFAGNWYLSSIGTAQAQGTVFTTENFDGNSGFYVSWFAPNWGLDKGTALNIGYKAPNASSWLRVGNDGQVYVFYGTAFQGVWSMTDKTRVEALEEQVEELQTRYGEFSDSGQMPNSSMTGGAWQSLIVIPKPHRELLVMSPSAGGAFVATIQDLPPYDGYQTVAQPIAHKGPLWFNVPTGQVTIQLFPLGYATAGTVYSMPHYCYYAPGSTQTCTVTTYAGSFSAACAVSGTIVDGTAIGTAFPFDGTASVYRTKCVLTGDGKATPFLSGVHTEFSAVMGTTYNDPYDIINYVSGASPPKLSVPDTPANVTFTMRVDSPTELSAYAEKMTRIYNRPVQVQIGSVTVFQGRTQPPNVEYGISDAATHVELVSKDWWTVLENYLFTDPLVLDGLDIGTALAKVVMAAGFSAAQLDIGTPDYRLVGNEDPANGNWAHVVKVGDTAAKIIEEIHRDNIPDWYMGFKPGTAGPVFFCHSPEELGTVPVGTVYTSQYDAPGGTVDRGHIARTYRETRLMPLANEVIVLGREPDTRNRIQVRAYDVDSYVGSTDPALRPDDWIGEQRVYILNAPEITTVEHANIVAAKLIERMCNRPHMVEIECDMLFKTDGYPVWRGDVIQFGTADLYRVESFDSEFVCDSDMVVWSDAHGTATYWRPTRYILEAVV